MQTNRLEAFSDGVFAIAITLLILEIKVPPIADLGNGLLMLWPSYLAYSMSFIVIGAIWINHHTLFEFIQHVDKTLLLLNTLNLLFVAFLPFPTAVLAEAIHSSTHQSIAAAFYGATLTLIGIFVNCMWRYATKQPRFLSAAISRHRLKTISRQLLIGPTGYAMATALAFYQPWISIATFVSLNIFFLWPRHSRPS